MIASPAPAVGTTRPAVMKLRTKRVRANANSPRGVALIPTGTAATCSASDVTCAIEISTFHSYASGNENTATTQFAAIQVMDSVESGIERVNSRMQGHFALSGKRHQLGQIIVGTDEIADKVDLGRNDVDGGNIERATVADDVVGTCASEHLDCVILSASLAYEVNDSFGPQAIGD